MKKYLIRLDDACPTMDAVKWQRMEEILDNYRIKPLVGVIPDNKDEQQVIDEEDPYFWDKVKKWNFKDWTIALHGYDHCYISDKGLEGLNPLWARSEFSGVPLDVQKQKIWDGYEILKSHGVKPKYFFAPSHTFDENTLKALKECTDIRIISDTIATKPYRKDDFIFIPQLGGHCMEIKIPGVWTFCLHPSTMSTKAFEDTERFIASNSDSFANFDEINIESLEDKDLISRLLSWLYFNYRTIRGIK